MEELTTQQQAEIIANKIINATKENIINRLSPALDKLASGHVHFTKELADAIITDIKNS
jgi:hypothetical protein